MILAIVGLVIAFVLCIHFLTLSITKAISTEQDKYKVKIGQKFILEKRYFDYCRLFVNYGNFQIV